MTFVRDVVVAAALGLLGLISLPGVDPVSDTDRPVDAVSVLLVLVTAGATVLRTRYPLPTLIAVATGTSAYLLLSYPYGPILVCVAVAVWTAARRGSPKASGVASALACGGLLLPLPLHPGALGGAIGTLPAVAWVAVPYTAGLARRLVFEASQRERAEADRRLIASERLRLAHEVHDIVGHALAAIQMQADIALHIGEDETGHERKALTTISRSSRMAMDELRLALGTDRPETPGADEPPPGLGRLDRLIEGVEAAGTHVELAVRGRPRDLPPRLDLSAYRLVQESLTNVVKHGTHPHANVTVTYSADWLHVEIANDHTAPGVDLQRSTGLGTSSMHRRVEGLGGTFSAGHHEDEHRYVVAATLPTDHTEATR